MRQFFDGQPIAIQAYLCDVDATPYLRVNENLWFQWDEDLYRYIQLRPDDLDEDFDKVEILENNFKTHFNKQKEQALKEKAWEKLHELLAGNPDVDV